MAAGEHDVADLLATLEGTTGEAATPGESVVHVAGVMVADHPLIVGVEDLHHVLLPDGEHQIVAVDDVEDLRL